MNSFVLSIVLALFAPGSYAQSSDRPASQVANSVACPASDKLDVYGADLSTAVFQAERAERIKLFQGWGENRKWQHSSEQAFVKVQFADRDDDSENVGWIPENSVRSLEDCTGYLQISRAPRGLGTGLDSPTCCGFPLAGRPHESYLTAPRSFGSNRSGGERKHAACDLYRNKNEKILAVTDGVVIRNLYYFYQSTYALEVEHSGGFVVRYGEVTGKSATTLGQHLRPGQTVGYMGKTDCCTPMLHFELYSGEKSGPLSVSGNKFRRRADLLNPTQYLQKWQNNTFRDFL